MYLISWKEEESRIDASLGGRVTAEEMHAFAEELSEVAGMIGEGENPYLVMLDHSMAKNFDAQTEMLLAETKDLLLSSGAAKVVSIVRDDHDVLRHTSSRLQLVLEGREEIVLEASAVVWEPVQNKKDIRRAA